MTALYIILSVIIVILAAYLLVFVRPRAKKPQESCLLCDYAHRGLHGDGVPENSLAAFELACKKGVGIELDVQLSRDGTVMVFHDYTLTRMTGLDKKLCEFDADVLTSLPLSGSEQTIPTLCQVLELVNGRVPLLVELKGEDLGTSLCKKVAEILSKYDGAYCVESFNPLLIRDIKKYLPDVYCGQLYTNVCRDKKKCTLLNAVLTCMALNFLARPDFIAYNQKDRGSLAVKLTTGLYRAPKFVWTVRSEEQMALARKNGEHIIFEKTDA